MKNVVLPLVIIILSLSRLFGQGTGSYGGYPLHQDWKYIETDIARIVYPKGLKQTAERVINMVTYISYEKNLSIGTKKKKVAILINNTNGISNGYVSVFPFQSEFYTLSPQDLYQLGSTNWMDQLTIHEYRHVQQYVNMKKDVVAFLSYFTGDYAWAGISNLIFPKWFFEGDAVVAETALSKGGRGRLPAFFKEQRALIYDSIQYRYRKMENGSLKDIVPNHYNLGYNMVREGREIAGPNVWNDVVNSSTKFKLKNLFYPFSVSTRQYVGMSSKKLYQRMQKNQEIRWREEWRKMSLDSSYQIPLRTSAHRVYFYQYPTLAENKEIYAVKSSYNRTSKIVQITEREGCKEKTITNIGITQDRSITYNNFNLAWTESVVNPFYKEKVRNKIMIYDLGKKKKFQLGKVGYYYAPEVSHDGKRVVVVEKSDDLTYKMLIWDIEKEKIINTLPNKDNFFLSQPQWSMDDGEILFIAQKEDKVAIMKQSLYNEMPTSMITSWSHHTISGLDVDEKYIYFGASFSGIDQIYSVSITGEKRIRQHTNDKIGAYYPTVDPILDTLIYSNFTSKGYRLRKVSKRDFVKEVPQIPYNANTVGGELVLNDEEEPIEEIKFDTLHQENSFHKPLYHFRPYAWTIYFDQNYFGGQVLFSDLFKELYANIGFKYNSMDEILHFNGELIYARYPVHLSIKAVMKENHVPRDDINSYEDYRWSLGANLPLLWYYDNFSIGINLSGSYTYHRVYLTGQKKKSKPESYLISGDLSVMHQKARKNIYPKFGQYVHLQYQKVRSSPEIVSSLEGATYIPGLAVNHGIKIDYGYQSETPSYILDDTFDYSRGYSNRLPFIDKTKKIGINYAFPLCYPDFSIAGITYLKRLRATLFYDYQSSQLNNYQEYVDVYKLINPSASDEQIYNSIYHGKDVQEGLTENCNRYFQRSYGVELYLDLNIFNSALITVGARASYLLDPSQYINSNMAYNFILAKNF
ncbi:hypothetical protein K5X82_00775 [Halosquirtibacter xylanolyticus]|uniref:TolB family protein n=1 Tax=Halosquirtibacter xylanolyticus TaxID=3374599 RepID=UPI00374A6095|nr:hypothetical protein K5X82_00775 [Prolixibacteraceae bacterium]